MLPHNGATVCRVEQVATEIAIDEHPINAAVRRGKANKIMTAVTRIFHVNIGIRKKTMPGARIQMIVVNKLTAPRMVPIPPTDTPMIHRSAPTCGEWALSDNGA